MKIYIMTDMEGVAGILNEQDWLYPASRYYETGRELLTKEVNAAIEGFFEAGADTIVVSDGHGAGGINPVMLDPRAELLRGWPDGWPLLLDESYDVVAWVGQHAKAGTEYSHITHTQWFNWIDDSINGVSIGEFGQFALCASELDVRCIFAAGEAALCDEAKALVPGIETVAVKRGTASGIGDDLDTESFRRFHLAAIHKHPDVARRMIRAGATRALVNWRDKINADPTTGLLTLTPPFERVTRFRPAGKDDPPTVSRTTHPDSVIALMNIPFDKQPVR